MDRDRQQTETKPGRYEDAALGFRNHWYPAMLSDEISEEQLLALTLLGESMLFIGTDDLPYRSVENLFEGDGCTLVWRRLASRYNRGLQKRRGQKTAAQASG